MASHPSPQTRRRDSVAPRRLELLPRPEGKGWAARLAAFATPLAVTTFVALAALRIYALFTTPVRTWDDRYYRWQVGEEIKAGLKLGDSVLRVFLPSSSNLLGERSIGYHAWYAMFAKLFPGSDLEHTWQYTNFALIAWQLFMVYSLARWATRDRRASLAVTAFYLLSPVVFGMTRWGFTENHAMAALMTFSALGAWVLDPGPAPARPGQRAVFWREIALPAAAAYAIGVFSTLREYMVPNFAAIIPVIVVGLLWENRRLAALSFTAVLAPFVQAMVTALAPVIRVMLWKAGHPKYFHPLTDWVPHVVRHTVGIPMTLFLVAGLALVVRDVWRAARGTAVGTARRDSAGWLEGLRRLRAIDGLLLAHAITFVFYCAMVVKTTNRVARPAIPPMLTLFALILIAARIFRWSERGWTRITTAALVPLSLVAWVFMVHALFFAFGGGPEYALDPYPLEHYNIPLHLRPMRDDWDMHVTWDPQTQAEPPAGK